MKRITLMAYSKTLLDHYEKPKNVGSLDKGIKDVGTGLVGAPACGDVMKLQIRVNNSGVIEDAKFKTFGCGSAIASSSLITEWVKGKSIDEANSIKNTEIANHLTYMVENSFVLFLLKMQLKLQSLIIKIRMINDNIDNFSS